ncbi:BspA family leucine-rich repeat surface protein [Chryseobacterium sp. Mn2064]|uniref:BspA family leucine-rich repeat surface protein n=1 Tax=Chryseobacterium sp. Mn2064 TaxID=3395263 RepID=UPI003BCB08F4
MKFKRISILIFIVSSLFVKAQNEFITIWKPDSNVIPTLNVNAPFQASSQQIWFPGIGENYTITWEEVGYPQHNGILDNVTSTKQVLIDFGTSFNDGSAATYRVRASNGNGVFRQIQFGEVQLFPGPEQYIPIWQINGSADKILEIEQWGNITWKTMKSAFSNCKLIQITATDAPILSGVKDASFMFYGTRSLTGASSMQYWNTSTIENFSYMFSLLSDPAPSTLPDQFNSPYINSWDMSSATDLCSMLAGRVIFNQSLDNWNVSKVKDMSWMFAQCLSYNQRMDNWDTSSLEDMHFMFHVIPVFNQPLNWNTSKVTNMAHVFHGCKAFNQSLEHWDTTQVTRMDQFLNDATSFNQPLGNWNLASLGDANAGLYGSAISCENYSKTLAAWADNPNTANNVSFGAVTPLKYAPNVTDKRDILLNKGWVLAGDVPGSCFLSVSEAHSNKKISLYPNPAVDDIHIEGLADIKSYKIYDASGRLVKEGNPNRDIININNLPKGDYILQLIIKDTIISSKFIKK